MIKLVVIGVWVCAVALGVTYGVIRLTAPETTTTRQASYFGGLDYVKTDLIGVPIIRDGALQGYVLAQFVFTIEQRVLQSLAVKPQVFLRDAAFRRLYTDTSVDYRALVKHKLGPMTDDLRTAVNERYGQPLIRDLLIERIDYLPLASVRAASGNRIGRRPRLSARQKKPIRTMGPATDQKQSGH